MYFYCYSKKCNFYSFWTLDDEKYNVHKNANEGENQQGKNQLQIQALTVRVQNLKSMQSEIKMMMLVNMLLFGITISISMLAVMK